MLSKTLSPSLATQGLATAPTAVLRTVRTIAPGVGLCLGVTLAADLAQVAERRLFGRAWLEALVLAILIGAAVRTARGLPARAAEGVHFSAKLLLEVAVLLLGASVSGRALLAAGPGLLIGIVAIVALAITLSYGLGRLLGLTSPMALLVGCGNAICGNSAIAAVAPVIDACGEDVAAAIGFTAVLGVVCVLSLPLLAPALHLGQTGSGVLAGLTVYAVPQVLAATAPMGALAVQVGTLVKLVRVLILGPVCLVLSLMVSRKQGGGIGGIRLAHAAPWFIVGFLVLAAARTAGWLPAPAVAATSGVANLLTVVAMAGLGLQTDLKSVAGAGPRVTAAVCLSLLVLGGLSLGLIRLLHLG